MAKSNWQKAYDAATSPTGVKIIAGLLIVGGLYYTYRKSKQTLQTVEKALDPTSPENIVNTAFSKAGQAITGDTSWTLDETLSRMFGKSAAEKQVTQILKPSEKVVN